MTPFSHILSEATREMNLMGEVGVGFSFGWMDIGAKKKFGILKFHFFNVL